MTTMVHSAQPATPTPTTVDPTRIEAARERAGKLPAAHRLSATGAARAHLSKAFEGDDTALGLRLGIKKSGCSGFAYVMDVARSVEDDDLWFDCGDGIAVITDTTSFDALRGSTLDYVVEGLTRMLHVENPNIEDSCGCGESFTVRDEA
ncbi:MAG: iron-sulfur cluster assembly accessory protein [Halothiobacillaceae bacterium]|nr:iron-sulfur cluster assembly accessory protein [Halothiobacillaceae bacterium]